MGVAGRVTGQLHGSRLCAAGHMPATVKGDSRQRTAGWRVQLRGAKPHLAALACRHGASAHRRDLLLS